MKNNEGHRGRLRNRFLMSGLSGFQDYEILELLLTYVIVRKDCKAIAKELLEKYGDLYTLLKQSPEELEKKYFGRISGGNEYGNVYFITVFRGIG